MDTECPDIGFVLQRVGGGLKGQLNRNISSHSQEAWVSSWGQCMNSRAPTSLAVCNVVRRGSGQSNLRSY